jgi:hypothetical protein
MTFLVFAPFRNYIVMGSYSKMFRAYMFLSVSKGDMHK